MSKHVVFELHPGIVLKGQLSMANDIVVTGVFEGDLATQGRLTVAEGGVVRGSIEAGSLILEEGNQVEAKIKIGSQPKRKASEEVRKEPGGDKWSGRLKKLKEIALGRK